VQGPRLACLAACSSRWCAWRSPQARAFFALALASFFSDLPPARRGQRTRGGPAASGAGQSPAGRDSRRPSAGRLPARRAHLDRRLGSSRMRCPPARANAAFQPSASASACRGAGARELARLVPARRRRKRSRPGGPPHPALHGALERLLLLLPALRGVQQLRLALLPPPRLVVRLCAPLERSPRPRAARPRKSQQVQAQGQGQVGARRRPARRG